MTRSEAITAELVLSELTLKLAQEWQNNVGSWTHEQVQKNVRERKTLLHARTIILDWVDPIP